MRNSLKLVPLGMCVGYLAVCGCKKPAGDGQPVDVSRDVARHTASISTQAQEPPVGEVPKVKHTLELTGPGLGKPTVFTYAELAGMEMTQLDDVLMLKSHEDDEVTGWRGPSLNALLKAAELKPGPMTLTLEAKDGYEAEVSLEDMSEAIIALQDGEGNWLADRDQPCPLRLVPPHKPGNYWIMSLVRITVEPVPRGVRSK